MTMGSKRQVGGTARELRSGLKWGLFGGLTVVGAELFMAIYGMLVGWWTRPSLKPLAILGLGGFAIGFLVNFVCVLDFSHYLGMRNKDVM
jgi:CHASE2 domain-containing sensor protein